MLRWMLGLAIAGLFAVGIWTRISSLEGLPDLDGDEAWYGVQAAHFLRGQPYTFWTPHHNPINPFHTGIVGLLLLVFRPEMWILRAPCLLTGLLAIPLTYRLGARVLDRPTALIAAALMAVLPVSIVYSRTGYDGSQLLLFSLLALYAAFRAHRGGLALMVVVCFLAHPTSVFLAPVLAGVYLVRSWPREASLRRRLARFGAVALASTGAVLLGFWTLRRPGIQHLFNVYRLGYASHHDWAEFWGWFGRLFLAVGRNPRPVHDRVLWIVTLPLLVVGAARLAHQRQWDRLALVAGVILGAVGILLVGGSTILQPGMTRYGLYLVAPTALAVACLVRACLAAPTTTVALRVHRLQLASAVALGWLLVAGFRMEELTNGHVTDGDRPPRADTIWTFGQSEQDASRQALRGIFRELRQSRNGPFPRVLIAEDWNTYQTLAYLASDRKSVSVVWLADLASSPDVGRRVRELMTKRRAYGIGPPGGAVESVVRGEVAPERLERWDVARYGRTALAVFQARPASAVAVAPSAPSRR
jgi:4-amino-4-deoxy-L-arabinose transferase-like glycosyltransferase